MNRTDAGMLAEAGTPGNIGDFDVYKAVGRFASLSDANNFVNRILEQNAASVDAVAAGTLKELLSCIDVVMNIACDEAPEAPDLDDVLGRAMKMLTPDQLAQIPAFVDQALSTTQDPERLARLFATGSSYRVWRSEEGPRNALLEIKKAAIAVASSH